MKFFNKVAKHEEGHSPGDQSWLTGPVKSTLKALSPSNLYNSFKNQFDSSKDATDKTAPPESDNNPNNTTNEDIIEI
jgi:hypothetical protein